MIYCPCKYEEEGEHKPRSCKVDAGYACLEDGGAEKGADETDRANDQTPAEGEVLGPAGGGLASGGAGRSGGA